MNNYGNQPAARDHAELRGWTPEDLAEGFAAAAENLRTNGRASAWWRAGEITLASYLRIALTCSRRHKAHGGLYDKLLKQHGLTREEARAVIANPRFYAGIYSD